MRLSAAAFTTVVASLANVEAAQTFDLKKVVVEKEGEGEGDEKFFFAYEGERISPWHDIPFVGGIDDDGSPLLSFVCEIPKGTTAK